MASQSVDPTPPFETARILAAPNVTHGFFGRIGGVSTGLYASLNTGFSVGDDVARVIENNARAVHALGGDPAKRFGLNQTHSNIAHVVRGAPWAFGTAPAGDALVTDEPGITLSVLTADCAPVLFYGDGVIGAAHAGWGGAVGGILESALAAMEKLGAAHIRAAIGPCIGPESYEVSSGFEAPFLMEDASAARFFRGGATPGKQFFDLPGYCAFRLARAGLTDVEVLGHDTCTLEDTYFSHRRMTKRGEAARGLQLSAISLKAS